MVGVAEIELFDSRAAETIAGWAGDAAASMLWCSLPAVSRETVETWASSPSVEAFVLREADRVVAYGEVWVDADEQEVELAHLIVDPSQRGSGLGTQLVVGLVEQARRHYPMVALRVHSRNDVAIRCYAAAGFERVSAAEEAEWNVAQPVDYVWMTHRHD